MAKIGLPKGSGKRLKVREKLVKSQGILKWILSGNPENPLIIMMINATKEEPPPHMNKINKGTISRFKALLKHSYLFAYY